MMKEKGRKGLISKTIESCRSFGGGRRAEKLPATPAGCFSVYVGPERERFVVRTEQANHPLFRTLLDEAEGEYGYSSGGPIELPCDVNLFNRVLEEVDDQKAVAATSPICGLTRSRTECDLTSSKSIPTGRYKTKSSSFS